MNIIRNIIGKDIVIMNIEILSQAIINGLLIGSIYVLIALGLTLIWGTMEIVNFAHGDFLMIGMYTSFWLFTLAGIDPLASLPIVFCILFILGIFFYKVLIKKVLNSSFLSQVLVTFGLGLTLQGLARFLWKSNYRLIQGNILQGTINIFNIIVGVPQLFSSFFSIVVVVILVYFLDRTKTGRAIKATTINKEAAQLAGINIEYIFTLVVGLGIALVGIAGGLLANFYFVYPEIGFLFGTLAYVVVAIGGFGSIWGAVLGGLLLGVVSSLSGILISPAFKYLSIFLIYLIVISIKPKGMKGW